jgi:hypothetical protein
MRKRFPIIGHVNLLDDTIGLLKSVRDKNGDLSVRSIASEPDVPYEWLKRFVRDVEDGKTPDPAVSRVQALHARLTALKSSTRQPERRACRDRA